MIKKSYLQCSIIFMILIVSCSPDSDNDIAQLESVSPAQYNSDVVVSWFNLIKVLTTETAGYTPPVAARAFGYTGIALYESIQVGSSDKLSLTGRINDLNIETTIKEGLEYHWPTVANTTMAIMTKFFYSNASIVNYSRILELETEFNNQYSNDIAEDVVNRSITFANDLTEQIILWSTTDGGYAAQFNNFPTEYENN